MIVARDASRSGAVIDVFRGPIVANADLVCDAADVVVFCRDGRVLGALGPGRAPLGPQTAPFLQTALSPDGSFGGAVYFVKTLPVRGIRFGGPLGVLGGASGTPISANAFGEATATIRDALRVVQAISSAPDADPDATFSSYVGYAILEAARTLAAQSTDARSLATDTRAFSAQATDYARQRLGGMGIELGEISSFSIALEDAAPAAVAPAEVAYEMLWDCKFCGTKKLLGLRHRHCPSCGAPQNAEDRYFPSDADKVRAEDHVYYGADVRCTHCGDANSKNSKHCGGCGAPLEGVAEIGRRQDQVVADGFAFAGQTAADARRERAPSPTAQAKPKTSTAKIVASVGCLSVLAILALAIVAMMWKKEGALVVTGHKWRRAIDIERFGPTPDSSWCDSVPLGAHNVTRSREVRSTRRIPDGQDCRTRKVDRGNGTFVEKQECSTRYRDEPIYDDRCHYLIDRWAVERTVDASGTSTANVAWPNLGALRACSFLGCERAGSRKETYTLELTDSDSAKQTCDFDATKWASFPDGSHWKGRIRVIGGGLDCSTLTQN